MDGTLADSSHYHWESWQDTLAREGIRVTHADFEATFGMRNAEILRLWLGADADPARIARIGDEKEEAYRALLRTGGIEPLPGAAEWVAALHGEGWRQAVASSAPRANIAAMVAALGFGNLLDAYLGAEDVTRGKPDPEVFLSAAERLGVARERCVVVEDAAAGIEAARRAGMANIGVGDDSLGDADVLVRSLADLKADAFVGLLRRGGMRSRE